MTNFCTGGLTDTLPTPLVSNLKITLTEKPNQQLIQVTIDSKENPSNARYL